jgi:hypothetical protein
VRLGALSAIVPLVLVAPAARAQTDPLVLTWSAPPECPSGDDVRRAAMRGVDTSRLDGVLEADAKVDRRPEASAEWHVHLRTSRKGVVGERDIDAPSCEGLAEATAVLLGLALHPEEATAEPAAPTVEPSVQPPKPKPEVEPASYFAHAFAIGASGVVGTAALPSTATGGAVTVSFTPGHFVFEVDGRRWVSQSQTRVESGAGAHFSMTTLGGRACWAAIRTDAFDVSPCAGLDVHLTDAQGYGAVKNVAASATWGAANAGVLGRLPITTWLGLRARAEISGALARPTFVVEDDGPVHRPALFGTSASLGVEVHFL